jgi:hypothetical protein
MLVQLYLVALEFYHAEFGFINLSIIIIISLLLHSFYERERQEDFPFTSDQPCVKKCTANCLEIYRHLNCIVVKAGLPACFLTQAVPPLLATCTVFGGRFTARSATDDNALALLRTHKKLRLCSLLSTLPVLRTRCDVNAFYFGVLRRVAKGTPRVWRGRTKEEGGLIRASWLVEAAPWKLHVALP